MCTEKTPPCPQPGQEHDRAVQPEEARLLARFLLEAADEWERVARG